MKVKKVCLNDSGILIPGHLIERPFRKPVFYPFDSRCGFSCQVIHNKKDLMKYTSAFLQKGKKSKLIAEVREHPYVDFHKHKELIGLAVCSEMFCEADEEADFEEVIFAVEKDWLVNFMNRERVAWNGESVMRWLQDEYTSYDSYQIYEEALKENAIVMIDFDEGAAWI